MTSEFNKGKYAPKYVPDEKYRPKTTTPQKGAMARDIRYIFLSLLGLTVVFVGKYFFDFRLLPLAFPALYPVSVGAILLWLGSTIIVSFLAIKFISGFGILYEITDAIYALLVLIWPLGLYGLGNPVPVLLGSLIAWATMRIIQRVLLWIFILVGFVRM